MNFALGGYDCVYMLMREPMVADFVIVISGQLNQVRGQELDVGGGFR